MIVKETCVEVIHKAFNGEVVTKDEFEGVREAIICGVVFGCLDFQTMQQLQNYSGEDYGAAIYECFEYHVSFRFSMMN